jgi:hypothetical protein
LREASLTKLKGRIRSREVLASHAAGWQHRQKRWKKRQKDGVGIRKGAHLDLAGEEENQSRQTRDELKERQQRKRRQRKKRWQKRWQKRKQHYFDVSHDMIRSRTRDKQQKKHVWSCIVSLVEFDCYVFCIILKSLQLKARKPTYLAFMLEQPDFHKHNVSQNTTAQ